MRLLLTRLFHFSRCSVRKSYDNSHSIFVRLPANTEKKWFVLFDLTRLKIKRSSILCRVATDAMYCRRFCAVIKIKARSTNMNPRHGIFVLHYFFIEYSLAFFLKCHAAYWHFFPVFYVHSIPDCFCAATKIIPHTASVHTKER